jgi:preprotein translocase subunit YajC
MGGAGLFIIVIAFLFLYFVLVRPQKRRQQEQQRMLNQVSVGDEIVTAGGIYGEVTAVDDDDVRVRIAPDLEVRVARRAIAGVTRPEPDENDELEEPEEPERPEPTPGT